MWHTLKKYLKIEWAFFRASLAADLEYRMNFFIHIFNDLLWYSVQIISFEVIFSQTERLGTWTIDKTRVFLGILFLIDAIYMVFLQNNLDKISEKIRKGDLDLLLAKPVNSQFMMSFQRLATAYFINIFLASVWIIWSISRLQEPMPFINIFWLLVFVPCGVMVAYSLRFFFSALSLIIVRAENLQYLWYQLYRLGTRPDNIYNPWIKYLILTIIPVGLIASVPARSILEPANYFLFVWTIAMSAFCIFLSAKFWKYALKQYSSASS